MKQFHSTPKGDYFHSRDALGRMGSVHFKPKGGTRMTRLGLTEGSGSHHAQAMSIARRHSAGSTTKSEENNMSDFEKASSFSKLAHQHGASMRSPSAAGFHNPKKAKAFASAARAAGHAVRHGRSSSMGGMHTVHLHKSNPNTEESFMSFEEIFKSEADHCESCGQSIEKGMKHKKKGKRGVAQMIGNEMDPHKGKPSGSVFVGPSRPNNFAGPVDRQSSSRPRAPKSGIVKEGGMAKALFPTSQPVLVTYEGLGQDAELARNIEASLTPGAAHSLFVPSQRNLAIENEQGISQDE